MDLARRRDDLRRFGAGWTLYRLVADVLDRAVGLRHLDCLELSAADIDPSAYDPDPPYEARFLAPDEIRSFAKDPENQLPPRWVEAMLAWGAECFGIVDGPELASFGWYSRRTTAVDRALRVRFDPDWAYMFHGYTKPAWRGQHLHALGIARATRALAGRGVTGIVTLIERRNRASARTAGRLGFRRFGSVLRVGRRRRAFWLSSPGSRAHGFRIRRQRQRPPMRQAPDLARVLAAEREIMDGFAPHYRRLPLSNPWPYQEERRRFVDWVLARLREAGRDPTALSYLDAGCGTGEIAGLLAGAGCARVTGLDLSPGMLAEARRAGPPGAAWVRGVIEQHPFGASRFDVVIAAFTVHHMRDVRPFFEMVDDVLADAGFFFLLEYDARAWSIRARPARALRWLAEPLRRAIARKSPNAALLGAVPPLPDRFNPGHRVRSFAQLRRALPAPERWRLQRDRHDRLLAPFHKVLVRESAFDRAFLRTLRALDRFVPLRPGHFQWVAGEALDPAPGRIRW